MIIISYRITCYFSDEHIATTNISIPYTGRTYSGNFGDNYISISGFTGSSIFTVVPSEGCEFTRWVYRLGSTEGTVQYSYNQEFVYTGSQDIYIRAEGIYKDTPVDPPDVEPVSWSITTKTIGNISDVYRTEFYIGKYELYRYRVMFTSTGKALFSLSGDTNINQWFFLSTSTNWDKTNGRPTDYIKSNYYDGSLHFGFSHDVTKEIPYYIWIRSYSGTDTGNLFLTIDPPISLPSPPYGLITYRVNGGFIFSWSGTENNYMIKLVRNYDGHTVTRTTSTNKISITGLQYGVTYRVYVKSYNLSGEGEYQFGYDCTTAPARPYADYSVNTDRSITVNWFLEDTTSGISKVWINLYDGNNVEQLQSIVSENETYGTVSFNNISDGNYHIRIQSMLNINNTEIVCVDENGYDYTYTTEINVSVKPAPWSWEYSNGMANNYQTQSAYFAITNKGYVTDFSYLVWNDFIEKVKEFLEYSGLSNSIIGTNSLGVPSSITYSALANKAKATSLDKDITANRFNYIRYCIDAMNSTGISKVSPNDIIYGSYFITMANKLNEV